VQKICGCSFECHQCGEEYFFEYFKAIRQKPYLDFVLFLTIFFHLLGVYWRSREVVELTHEYFADPKRWEIEKWPTWVEMEKM